MDSGVGRRNDDGSPAVASTSQLQQPITATAQEFATRLNAIHKSWQEGTGQGLSSNIVTPQSPSQSAVPRSMHTGSGPTDQVVPAQWTSVAPTQSRTPMTSQNSSTSALPSFTPSQVPTVPAQVSMGQQQSRNTTLVLPPSGSARSNTEIWRMALQMNPDERQIFLDEEMRKLAELSPTPQTLPVARRSNTSSVAQGQVPATSAVGRVQSQWKAANQVVQQPMPRAASIQQQPQQQRQPPQSVAVNAYMTLQQPMRRVQQPAASPSQQPQSAQPTLASSSNNQLALRHRASTQITASASPVQQSQSPATSALTSTQMSSEAAQLVIQRLMPRGFVAEPRLVPKHVRHFSRMYEDDVRKYAVRQDPVATSSTSIQPPDESYERLKVKMDSTPVPKLLQESAGGVGRLAGLLPATDLLDREAHSTQFAIITLVNAMRETENNVATVTRRNRELEEQLVDLKKEMAAYKPILDAVLKGLPQVSQSNSRSKATSGSHHSMQREQGVNTKPTTNGRVSELEVTSAQTVTTPPMQNHTQITNVSEKAVDETAEEASRSSKAMLTTAAQQVEANGAGSTASNPTDNIEITEATPSLTVPALEASVDATVNNKSEESTDMQIDSEEREGTITPPRVKGEEEELEDQLKSPKRTTRLAASESKDQEAEVQGTPSRTLRSASQKVNTPVKDASSPVNKKRKRSMQSSFRIHRGKEVECINIDSSEDERDEE